MRRLVLALAGMVVIQVACSCAKKGPEPTAPEPVAGAKSLEAPGEVLGAKGTAPAAESAESGSASAKAAPAASGGAECVMNLFYLSKALGEYTHAHGGKLPGSGSRDELSKALAPYLKGDAAASFTCPENGKPYQFNASLAGKKASSVGSELVLKDSAPHGNGDINAVTVGGTLGSHVAKDPALAKGTFR